MMRERELPKRGLPFFEKRAFVVAGACVEYVNERFQSEQPDSREINAPEPHVPQSTGKLAAEQCPNEHRDA